MCLPRDCPPALAFCTVVSRSSPPADPQGPAPALQALSMAGLQACERIRSVCHRLLLVDNLFQKEKNCVRPCPYS